MFALWGGRPGCFEQGDPQMMTNDDLMGIKKPDMTELKEVKVKLPVRQLLKLHYLKLTSSRTFSDLVSEALADYFEAHGTQHHADAN